MAKPKTPKTPKVPKGANAGGFYEPPFMSFDPAIGAERRALGRGLSDTLVDARRARKFAGVDYKQRTQDLNTRQGRELQNLSFRRDDLNTSAERGREDFTSRITGLIRNFQTQGREQLQAANAAGVLGGSASKAAAARRGENLAIARQPIDLGRQRLEEDTAKNLGRLGLAEGEIYEDTNRDRMLAGRDIGRTRLDLRTKVRRAKREALIGEQDLIQSAIYSARERKPGVFTPYGTRKSKKK